MEKYNIGRLFNKIVEKSSKKAREFQGEKHLRDKEFEEKEHFWNEIKEKHGFGKDELCNESNYFIDTLLDYLNLQDKTEDLFETMVAEKKFNGESEKYNEIKAEWQEAKEKLSAFHLADEKLPNEIEPSEEGEFAPDEFIRKFNLGKLKRSHRNLLLDLLTSKKYSREKYKKIKEEKAEEVSESETVEV